MTGGRKCRRIKSPEREAGDSPRSARHAALVRCDGGRPGWDLLQLRHSAATTFGEKGTPLQLIMAKTRHRNPRTAMCYIKPGPQAVAEVTDLLDTAPPRR